MILSSFILLFAQSVDSVEQCLANLAKTQAEVAAGKITGLDVSDAFFQCARALRTHCESGTAPAEAFHGWSQALLACNDLRNARAAAETGLSSFPNHLNLSLLQGRIIMAQAAEVSSKKDRQSAFWSEALEVFHNASATHKKRTEPCIRKGEVLVYMGEAEKAKAAWQEALKRDHTAVNLAGIAPWLGGEVAADLIQVVLDKHGEDPLTLWHLASAEYAAFPARWESCQKNFLRVMELEPSYDSCWYFLAEGSFAEGNLLTSQKKTADGLKAYRKASRAWAHYLSGPGGAAHLGVAAAEGGDGVVANLKWLGGQAFSGGDADTAIQLYQWAVKARPQDAEAWNNLAFFLREVHRAEESLAAYRAALSLQEDDPQVMNDLAVILHYYLKTGDEEAKDLYQKAITRAEEILAHAEELSPEEKNRMSVALRDARNNLRKLQMGNRRNG